jgi:acyl-coenzyme A synthetase/AMP-(fatty) acid ligase
MPARASADDQRFFLTESGASALIYHEQFDDTVSKLRANLPQMTALIRVGDTSPRQGTLDYTALFGTQPVTAPDVAIDKNDLAFIAFTSGTTGTPKGVLQSHATWSHYLVTAGVEIADTRACEVFAHGAPLTHFTQPFVMPTFIRGGGTNVILPGLSPACCSTRSSGSTSPPRPWCRPSCIYCSTIPAQAGPTSRR